MTYHPSPISSPQTAASHGFKRFWRFQTWRKLHSNMLSRRRKVRELLEKHRWARIERRAAFNMAHLSDHMLEDIGITRAEIDACVKDPIPHSRPHR